MKDQFIRFSILPILIISACHLQAQSGIPEQPTDVSPLLVGENVPEVTIIGLDGQEVSLTSLLSSKPAVVIFYRGSWCPYCNVHLAELQQIEQQVLDLGYQIIAISPDDADHLQEAVEKSDLNYGLYSDKGLNLARAFGIAFQAPDRYNQRLDQHSSGENPGWLPVPSVFVVNQEGLIEFEYINPNYKVRLSGSLLLAVLKELKSGNSQ